jgi:hypothetical protein
MQVPLRPFAWSDVPLVPFAPISAPVDSDAQLVIPNEGRPALALRTAWMSVLADSDTQLVLTNEGAPGLTQRQQQRRLVRIITLVSMIGIGIVVGFTCIIVGSEIKSRPVIIAGGASFVVSLAVAAVGCHIFTA